MSTDAVADPARLPPSDDGEAPEKPQKAAPGTGWWPFTLPTVRADRLLLGVALVTALAAASYGPFLRDILGMGTRAGDAAEGSAARQQAIEMRLDRIEEALETAGSLKPASDGMSSARAANIVSAVRLVAAALEHSGPYDVELVVAYKMIGHDPELISILDELREHAETGIPTIESLRATFPARIEDAMQLAAGEGAGVFGTVAETLAGAARLMGFGNATQKEIEEGHLNTALGMVDAGQISLTLAVIDKLSGPSRSVLEPWRRDAEARIAADDTLTRLRREAYKQVLAAEW